jgi:hypothetical protein
MPAANPNKPLTDWLKTNGYTPAEIKKVMEKLADHDHQTLSDAVFDSIGNDGQTLDEIIRGILQDA